MAVLDVIRNHDSIFCISVLTGKLGVDQKICTENENNYGITKRGNALKGDPEHWGLLLEQFTLKITKKNYFAINHLSKVFHIQKMKRYTTGGKLFE